MQSENIAGYRTVTTSGAWNMSTNLFGEIKKQQIILVNTSIPNFFTYLRKWKANKNLFLFSYWKNATDAARNVHWILIYESTA